MEIIKAVLAWGDDLYATVTQHPSVTAALVLLGWLLNRAPWGTIWRRTRRWMSHPWDLVPMPVAASYALGRIDGTAIAQWARERDGGRILSFIATYIANYALISAVRPPAMSRVIIDPGEFKSGLLKGDGGEFFAYSDTNPMYVQIAVCRWRLWLAIARIRRATAELDVGW